MGREPKWPPSFAFKTFAYSSSPALSKEPLKSAECQDDEELVDGEEVRQTGAFGDYIGTIIVVAKGDTWGLDYGSCSLY